MSLDLLIPLAHVGHWWIYVLYAVPVIIVLASVAMTLVRERRRNDSNGD